MAQQIKEKDNTAQILALTQSLSQSTQQMQTVLNLVIQLHGQIETMNSKLDSIIALQQSEEPQTVSVSQDNGLSAKIDNMASVIVDTFNIVSDIKDSISNADTDNQVLLG